MELLPVLLLGLLLGVRHAADPDHVVAVSTILARKSAIGAATRVGAMWGVGHTLTILTVGTAITVFKVVITPRVGLTMEFAVALMLIVLGTLNLFGLPRKVDDRSLQVRPFIVGLVHGLAGSAAVGLLVLAAIPDTRWSVAYLLVFGLGTVLGMMSITAVLSLPIRYASNRLSAANGYLRFASGALSIAFGLFLVHEIGFNDGLFTDSPHWLPQ
jgi:high-affinity nickel-transport protein